MNIFIRVDASIYIGSGHIMRCLVLAQGLVRQGHRITFVCRPQPGDMIDFLQSNKQVVQPLPELERQVKPENTSDYTTWLQVYWLQDARESEALITKADLVIVDHYGLNMNWEEHVKAKLGCKLFVIDDLVRKHNADIILDQTLLRQSQAYLYSNQDALILTGCDHALIKPAFSTLREAARAKKINTQSPKLLLTMGAIDQFNVTLKILNIFATQVATKPSITVLLGRQSPHYKAVAAFCREHDWVTHIDFVNDMPSLMHKHDLAIGAPGSTTWERACLGIPSILIPLAENQQTICQNMLALDAAISVAIDDISSHFSGAYKQLISKAEYYQAQNLTLCDGLGLNRVLLAVEQLGLNNNPIQLRKALQEDIDLVYQWQCQPGTRKYALNSRVPTLLEHRQWMQNKLVSFSDYFYIITLGYEQLPVGVIRLDEALDKSYLLSIFIDQAFYDRGIAKQALLNLNVIHENMMIKAQVLSENIASQCLFSSLGYQKDGNELFIREPLSSKEIQRR